MVSPGAGDPALADAGALDDPLVAGVDALLEVGVGEPLLGEGGAPAGDARPRMLRRRAARRPAGPRGGARRGATSMPTSCRGTGCAPGVDVPGPSSTPTVWPSSTWSPSSTSSSGRNTPTDGATIMRSGTRSPSPWVKQGFHGLRRPPGSSRGDVVGGARCCGRRRRARCAWRAPAIIEPWPTSRNVSAPSADEGVHRRAPAHRHRDVLGEAVAPAVGVGVGDARRGSTRRARRARRTRRSASSAASPAAGVVPSAACGTRRRR